MIVDGTNPHVSHSISNDPTTMSSIPGIPAIGLPFRIVGIVSECAIFCRYSPSPDVGQISVSDGVYPDQWFTLIPGIIIGRYAIKSRVTGKVLYSRSESPRVGQIEGDGKYDDK